MPQAPAVIPQVPVGGVSTDWSPSPIVRDRTERFGVVSLVGTSPTITVRLTVDQHLAGTDGSVRIGLDLQKTSIRCTCGAMSPLYPPGGSLDWALPEAAVNGLVDCIAHDELASLLHHLPAGSLPAMQVSL